VVVGKSNKNVDSALVFGGPKTLTIRADIVNPLTRGNAEAARQKDRGTWASGDLPKRIHRVQ
jgi:hypothetical protein